MYAGGVKAIFLFLVIVSILGWLSFYFGYTQYFLIKQQIPKLSGSERENAEQEFFALDKTEDILAGTIAKISLHGGGGIWVWSNQGLKFFQANKYTHFSYFDVCASIGTPGEEFFIDSNSRKITADIKEWTDLVKAGDFVQLAINTPEGNNDVGKLRAVNAFSLPLFLPMKLDRLCSS